MIKYNDDGSTEEIMDEGIHLELIPEQNDAEESIRKLKIGIRGAIAALSQNKTYQMDIEVALKWLRESL